jgi:hypothetical protein
MDTSESQLLGILLVLVLVAVPVALSFLFNPALSFLFNPSPSYGLPAPPADALLQLLWQGKGLLNSSVTLQQACPGYFDPGRGKTGCPKSAADCKGGVINFADYKSLNNVVATQDNGITCFALATTLQNSRLAQMVFGPFGTGDGAVTKQPLTGDMTVGVFLDLQPLQKYIGCLSLLDSGSVGRYGDPKIRIPQAMEITSERLSSDYQGVLDECASSDKCGLFVAGCAGSKGKKPFASQTGTGYNFTEDPFMPPVYKGPQGGPWLPKGWLYLDSDNGTPGTIPFFPGTDKGLASFEQTLIKTQNIVGPQADPTQWAAGSQCEKTVMFNTFEPPQKPIAEPKPTSDNTCPDYWSYQFHPNLALWNNGDGYRENECDLFVPQDKTAQPDPSKGTMKCVPDQGFVDAFRSAVVGIYATNYCAKDVQWVKDQNPSECCNLDISKSIALALADKYNATPGVPRKISAWVWDVVDPVGKWSAPSDPSKGRLNVTLITKVSLRQ